MTEQIIDSTKGELKFPGNFTVSSQTTPEEIIHFFGEENVDTREAGKGWKNYSVRNVKINQTYFIITFYFDNAILKMLDFIVNDKIIITGSWDDWSENEELQKRDYYNDWLTKQIGSNRQFIWGTIGSYYDNRGGSSSIVLKYN
ncbi:MAG: hypothetical protein ABI091_09965 [Ferruginibacter sp.]